MVTGASRGLGAGLAATFAADGMALGLCARTEPTVAGSADAVTGSVDVADAAAVDAFAAAVVERFGRIDLWVNNAGVLGPVGPLADADPGQVRAALEIDVLGVLHGTATFARHVRTRPGGGVLVNISSGAATKAYAGWAPYGAAKAAVEMATEVVAVEERHAGLRAYALSPGVIDTAMQERIRSTDDQLLPAAERFRRLHATGAFNSPEWVARFIVGLIAEGPDDRRPVRLRVPDEHSAATGG